MASTHDEKENALADVADISAEDDEGDIIDSGSAEEGEEKIEEGLIEETAAIGNTDSGSGRLKTPEDEGNAKDISNVSDANDEGKTQDAHQNNMEEAVDEKNTHHMQNDTTQSKDETKPSPQRGTIAAIPEQQENNTDAAQSEQIPINDDDSDESADVMPGFMFIAGPDYTGMGIHTGYDSGSAEDDDTITNNEPGVVLEGFLPEDDPSRRRNNTNVESLTERVQRLFDNAITLDDSAVRPIPDEGDDVVDAAQSNNGSGGGDDKVVKSDDSSWYLLLLLLVIAVCVILAIALPLSLRGDLGMTGSLSDAVCLPGIYRCTIRAGKINPLQYYITRFARGRINPSGQSNSLGGL